MPKGKAKSHANEATEVDVATIPGARRSLFPHTFNPMLAAICDGPLGKPGAWVFEPKMDGIRCIAMLQGGVARLLSRRGLDLTSQYPGLAAELPTLFKGDGILDGEIMAFNAAGKPSFQQLQQRMNLTRQADVQRAELSVPAHFFAFDIVRVAEFDVTGAKLMQRKQLLGAHLGSSERVHHVPHFDCDGLLAYDVCVENGFEGIVAKRSESPYECGRRSPSWIKVKAQQTGEFVIGGYSPGEGSRTSTFGALLLGFFDQGGKFIYCGSVGTGFDDRLLAETLRRLKPHVTTKPPFINPPKDKKNCVWVEPNVVAEIKYMDMTRDAHLRTPVFMHFRDDKAFTDVFHPDSQKLVYASAEVPDSLPMVAEASATVHSSLYDKVLGQLSGGSVAMDLLVGEEKVALTSLNKELWPKFGENAPITKRDYLRHLVELAPYLLPHWQGRPVTLIRSPFGVRGKFFYQKHWHTAIPEFVETLVYDDDGERKEYLLCNNLASLMFFAQNGVLEFHTFPSRLDLLNHPDYIVFDIDYHAKSNKAPAELDLDALARGKEVAFALYEYLHAAKLNSYVKLSGKNGLHVFVPIERDFDFSATRALAETIARFLVKQKPDLVTVELDIKKREGRVYLDCGSNGAGKTIAAPYTPRAVPWASVSAPVTWKELEKITPADLSLYTMAKRLASVGDIWADILTRKNDLQASLSKSNPK